MRRKTTDEKSFFAYLINQPGIAFVIVAVPAGMLYWWKSILASLFVPSSEIIPMIFAVGFFGLPACALIMTMIVLVKKNFYEWKRDRSTEALKSDPVSPSNTLESEKGLEVFLSDGPGKPKVLKTGYLSPVPKGVKKMFLFGKGATSEQIMNALNELKKPQDAENGYPKIDRSNVKPNFKKTEENDALDVGWNEGILDDGRPYRVEFWCQDQLSCLVFFISTKGLENATKGDFLRLLSKNELLRFKKGKESVAPARFIDPTGNEFWSLNVVIGADDELFVTVSPGIHRYKPEQA